MPCFVTLPHLRLAYREWQGERGPLLCLPHLSGHKGSFVHLAQALAPTYRVIALDLRGRGDSDKPAEGCGFAYHARDISQFADALGIDSFGLIGHSFGATTATYLASIMPTRVRALVLLDGGADPKQAMLKSMYETIRRLGRSYPSMDDYLHAMRALAMFQPWSDALAEYVREDVQTRADGSVINKSSPECIERDLDMHFYYSMCCHFPNVQCSTLFIRPTCGLVGDRGHVFTDAEAAAIVRHIPHGQRVDVADANHYTMLINAHPPIVEPIRDFLDSVQW